MEMTIKDLIYVFSIGAGAVAYVVASKVKTAENAKRMSDIVSDYKEKIKLIEDKHRQEISEVIERLNNKKRDFKEFRDYMHREVEELKKCASKCLDNEKAERKFVTRSEFKMVLDNVDLKLDNLDNKISILLEAIKK